jgi:dihydrolipoamide dehydrogenase
MAEREYDMLILGGGTGGYSAAFRASELGMTTAIIERDKLGGTCVHSGCIPTKSLLHTAEVLELTKRAQAFGIHVAGETVVWEEVMRAKSDAVAKIYHGLEGLVKARKVDLLAGNGRLGADGSVVLETGAGREQIAFDNLVLATGSYPRMLPGLSVDETVITSDQALNLPKQPESILVVGGGYIGVEFASLWRSFGVEVTMVEMAPRLLLQEDEEISDVLVKSLRGRGITVHLGAQFKSIVKDGGVTAEIEIEGESRTIRAEKLMAAVGREPLTEGFADADIVVEHGFVVVDDRLRTSRPGVYAVGDLLPTPQLAHVAFAEGIFVAEEIGGLNPDPINYDSVPHCVYSYPEVASVGLTEAAARRQGYEVVVAREPFSINARASVSGDSEGKAKIVAQAEGRILGVHLIGPRATELISEAMLVTGWEAEPAEVAKLIHPHPTLSEVIGEAALKLAGKPLHSL